MSARIFFLLSFILVLFVFSPYCESGSPMASYIVRGFDEADAINVEIDISLESTCLWTQMTHVEVSGTYAYCVVAYGLIILDISNTEAPEFVGRSYIPGAFDVAIEGDYAYITCGNERVLDSENTGLRIVDISDPYNPVLMSEYRAVYRSRGIDIQGDYAFVANETDGLLIIDISDRSSPVLAGQCPTESFCMDVVVRGDYAYIANYFGVMIVDISDVSNPFMTDSRPISDYDPAKRLDLDGDYIFVANDYSGLTIFNISDPYNILPAGIYNVTGSVRDVAISNSTAFITLRDSTLMMVDISNAYSPVLLGWYDSSMPYPTNSGLDVSGNHAFIADSNMLRIIDITNYTAPAPAGYYDLKGPPMHVTVSGNNAYIANRSGMKILDISDPAHPYETGYFWTPDKAFDIAVDDTIAYITDAFYGLRIVNIADPSSPVEILQYDTPGFAYCVEVYENCVYIGDDDSLRIIEVSDPAAPKRLASLSLPGTTRDIAFKGDHAFVADYDGGIHVLDISDPAECARVTDFNFAGYISDVYISGDYLYALATVTYGIRDLQIIDISTPSSPVLRSVFRFDNSPFNIEVIGDYAFVACSFAGLYVLNISNPDMPTVAGTHSTPGISHSLDVVDNHIYLADYYGFMTFSFESDIICGDANGDGGVNVGDAVYVIQYVFSGGPPPDPECSGDANGDGSTNIGDGVYVISYIFKGGPAPVLDCCIQ